MSFWQWLGTAEGRSVRYPMIGLVLAAIGASVIWMLPRGHGGGYDDGWVVVRPCGPIICSSSTLGGEQRVCGTYLLKRDPQGRYWRTNGNFRDEIDATAIDLICPLPKSPM